MAFGRGVVMKVWDAIGGRKFLALCLAIAVTVCMGHMDINLMWIFIAYMSANLATKFAKINGGNGYE